MCQNSTTLNVLCMPYLIAKFSGMMLYRYFNIDAPIHMHVSGIKTVHLTLPILNCRIISLYKPLSEPCSDHAMYTVILNERGMHTRWNFTADTVCHLSVFSPAALLTIISFSIFCTRVGGMSIRHHSVNLNP